MTGDENYFLLAAHQLRSPLVSMQTVIRVLIDTGLQDREKALSLIRQMDDRCGHMISMVNDLLSLGESGQQDEIPDGGADAGEILADVVASLEPVATAKSLMMNLEIKDCPGVKISPVSLEHVCMNIIENAVKYGKDGGAVNIAAGADGGGFILEVQDDGIGIPEGDLEDIFREFHRADNAKRIEKQGTGLGLAIVKKFVESVGGTISVKSSLGSGTTFTVRLPGC